MDELDDLKQKPTKREERTVKSIELHGTRETLQQERQFIKDTLQKAGIDDETAFLILSATDEASANVVEHFYKDDPLKKYVITVSVSLKKIIVLIESYGSKTDIKSGKKIDLEEHFREGKTRGLGIYFMHSLMDEVTYHYIEKMNVVKLVKYITKADIARSSSNADSSPQITATSETESETDLTPLPDNDQENGIDNNSGPESE